MKFLFSLLILFSLPLLSLKAQSFIQEANDTITIEYNDGEQWVYRNVGDIIVGMTNKEVKDDYGKYYQIGIFINNCTESTMTFNPEDVFADMLSNKGDTVALEVYTHEKYQKKIMKNQMWTMALYGFSAGLNAASAGYSTTYSTSYSPNGYAYTSVQRTYDANAAFQANMAANMQIQTLGKMMENDRLVRKQGYLKINTIHPGDAIAGYMNIKHKKGKTLLVNVRIGDREYLYSWDITKKKKDNCKR